MGIDPHKAWELFTIDPPDFLAMFALVITAVAIFVWWYRDHLVKERIATNEQRMALARSCWCERGAGTAGWIRTTDLLIHSQAL